ncbi:hypothetical protein H5407_05565 [Mitsuaria sp. WAJ17]|uniref:aKG-HExxH-type peptide beta-hydroxylase n=1 Tax=Mitsuaria sp. WAJ17 TaxID=2761452 RepID=UPI00160365B8|nr:HEXXH motif-containing putative peptide modification protein [Mitsuaria sp. WAJ17]MBB2484690.1 hypothetical protein [Mitsuaria sp. WAJ17]
MTSALFAHGFAPQLFTSAKPMGVMAATFHRGVLDAVSRTIDAGSPLMTLLDQCHTLSSQALPSQPQAWQPDAGAALRKHQAGRPQEALMHLMCALHTLRIPGQWQTRLEAPVRLGVDGHLFDVAGHLRLTCTTEEVRVERLDDTVPPLVLEWTPLGLRIGTGHVPDARWVYVGPTHLRAPGFEHLYLQSWKEPDESTVVDIFVDWPVPPQQGEDAHIAARSAQQVGEALQLLQQADPRYIEWILPLLRGLACCPLTSEDMRQSGSFLPSAGVFSCGFPLSTEFLGEVFVHEMSHQHYLLMSAIQHLTDPARKESTHYSTLKGKKRTISKILLTYHATANMLLYWHDLLHKLGRGSAENLKEHDVMLRHTLSLADILRSSDALMPIGRALFVGQAELLNARGYDIPTDA